ncbi:MAG: hypothetical protein AMXMBFR13_27490 [Phycisphaerae bacterium]
MNGQSPDPCARLLDPIGRPAALLVFVLALVILMPGIQVSLFDRDEGWYAQVSREMAESGDWLIPRYLGEPWLAKPPLLYWLVAGSFKLLGTGEWQARLVPVLASACNAVLVAALAASMFGRHAGVLAGILFMTAGLPAFVGRMLLTDAVMLLCTLTAILLHWRMAAPARLASQGSPPPADRTPPPLADHSSPPLTKGGLGGFSDADEPALERGDPHTQRPAQRPAATESPPLAPHRSPPHAQHSSPPLTKGGPGGVLHTRAAAYWLAIGLGILAKGPATLVFAGAFGLALLATPGCRSWLRNWRWWVWSPLAVLIAAPWYLYIARHAGGTFAQQFLWFEVLSRIAHAPHGHTGPPGYYLLISLGGLLPWTPLVPGALLLGVQRRRQEPLARLLLIWAAIPWLVLELIASKLPHYILPCYVPLMILLAWMLEEMIRAARPWTALPLIEKRVWRLWAGVMIVLGAGGMAAAAVRWDPRWGWPVVASGLALILGFALAGWLLRRSLGRALAAAVISCVALHWTVGWYLLPALEPFRLSRNLAEAINGVAAPGEPIALCGFQEPSTFFYLRHPAREIDRHALAGWPTNASLPEILAITERELDKLNVAQAGEIRSRAVGKPISGYNYVKMEPETIWVGPYSPVRLEYNGNR